ncbi:apoptosis regulator BALF1 [Equid gammaherpesvirus 2]|uniref:Uncharacterized gene E4 protein n=1 Tax=Equine herpesvirus 2 (strain 86/87) TaxID=82831 RepID=VGE4_EHV2|nr:apoptosis regulator BALF1 [Equid gammaherpesvirus 2]Q66610.1 RecName: Full=Uncharacterized gene E4 protein [Equid herpesvirus type 2 strain 86/87]AAC13792.1 apoptosis regulator BALF1 [Equid gammaherpesvirus 2]
MVPSREFFEEEMDRVLENEAQKLSLTNLLKNVFAQTLDMKPEGVLTTEEALLAWLVDECKKEYLHQLIELVMQVPVSVEAPTTSAINNSLGIIRQTHGQGEDNFGRLLCSLSFASCFLELVLQSDERCLSVFASELAKFYVESQNLWLAYSGGLSAGLRERFPRSWLYFALKQKWLRFIYFFK